LDVNGNASVSGTLAFHTGTGTIQTTAFSPLVIGGPTTGNITISASNDLSAGSVAPNVTNVTDLGLAGKLWRNIYGTALYQGINQVCDTGGNCSGVGNLWGQSNGSLYPVNNTVNVYFGATAATATTSAKFAFTGINGGTPTASIAGTPASGNATFIDGNGNISTTNAKNLTLGNSATYATTGNILLNPNGTGSVGIGTTGPASKLDVSGRIAQSGSTSITGYMMTNSGQLASSTNLNPGILVYGGDSTSSTYGMDIGYNGKFLTRFITVPVLMVLPLHILVRQTQQIKVLLRK